MHSDQANRCVSCGTPGLRGRFCTECGAPAGARPPGGAGGGRAWVAVGGIVVLLGVLAAVAVPERRARADARPATAALNVAPGGAAPATGAAGAVPLDISAMTPRERFDRLYERAMQASQTGQGQEAQQFMPMALAAYGMLDSIDADARYHAALLHMHAGGMDMARLLADTILIEQPDHLFGYLIRATAARWERDDAALAAAYRGVLEHAGTATDPARPEYDAHRATIDEAIRMARAAGGGS